MAIIHSDCEKIQQTDDNMIHPILSTILNGPKVNTMFLLSVIEDLYLN